MKRIEVIILNDDGTENCLEPIEFEDDIIPCPVQLIKGNSLVENSGGNTNNNTISEKEERNERIISKKCSPEESDELIMCIGNEKIQIPLKYVDEDAEEVDDGGLYVKLRASNGEKDTNDDNDDTISVEIDLDENSGSDEIELPLEDITKDIDIDDEVDLEIDSRMEESNVDQLNFVAQEKCTTSRKRCRCRELEEMDDEESEEYFYSGLALTANQISSYSDRLRLRMELVKCVMSAVQRSLENKQK